MADPFALRPESGHLSELLFDRMLAGETEGLAPARQHLEACPDCRSKLEALQAEQQIALSQLPRQVDRLVETLTATGSKPADEDRPRWSWQRRYPTLIRVGGAAAAVAAAAMIWLLLPQRAEQGPVRDLVRVKGVVARFELLQLHGDRALRVDPDVALAAGARLAFRTHCPTGCWAMLVALDESGPPTLLEQEERQPWKLPRSAEPTTLPVQVVLDDRGQRERFVALFCRTAPDRADVLARIRGAYPVAEAAIGSDGGRAARRNVARERPLSFENCVVRQQVVEHRGASDGN